MTSVFRSRFKLYDKDVLRWFPGHMDTGMKNMQQKLTSVDCIVEVHDARIPVSGRNPAFASTLFGIKPHILVLNKKDLTDSSQNRKTLQYLRTAERIENVVYTDCRGAGRRCSGVNSLIPLMESLIKDSERYNRRGAAEYNAMVIGVPNVGKSSLINTLRVKFSNRGKGALVGKIAGVTRNVASKIKVCDEPPVYVWDTPGILTPNVSNVEGGLKLALVSALQDHQVGEDVIADYLLFWLNKYKKFRYVDIMGLTEPTDDIAVVLTKAAVKLNRYKKMKLHDGTYKLYPDFVLAARHMIAAFRTGELGKLFLDRNIIERTASA